MKKTCGTCAHGAIIPNDLTKRVCHGAPPQIVVLPGARGPSLATMWPNVAVTEEACGLHKERPKTWGLPENCAETRGDLTRPEVSE